jgi:hypothetical protein
MKPSSPGGKSGSGAPRSADVLREEMIPDQPKIATVRPMGDHPAALMRTPSPQAL